MIARHYISLAQELELPAHSSLIRPLSGRIFMRRTVKNGWTARAIKGSLIDLEEGGDEGEGSDTGSLDSFFDDDFEDSSIELGKLLSCNTLGVESKVDLYITYRVDILTATGSETRLEIRWYCNTRVPLSTLS